VAAQVDAAHAGQHHVQQHQVRLRSAEQLDRLLGGAGGQHRVVICAEVVHQKFHNSGLVLDDEHG
jgi:RNase adaptor protein for sRNA GlmZ degradation